MCVCMRRRSAAQLFNRLLVLLGRKRSVYAPDLPGYGGSDAPAAPPAIEDYAAAIGDFLDTMRLRQVDLVGCQAGALIAAELAITRPQQVRRAVLISVPALNAAERAQFTNAPWPEPLGADGAQLQAEWRRASGAGTPALPAEITARRLAAMLCAGARASWGMHAVVQYAAQQRLGLITQPVLMLRPADEYRDATARARELLPKARLMDFAAHGAALCETAPEAVADAVEEFLR